MPISPRDRFLTFKRDSYTCQYCGRKAGEVILECDHVVARAMGGSDEIGNYITACRDCNRGKRTEEVISFEIPNGLNKKYTDLEWLFDFLKTLNEDFEYRQICLDGEPETEFLWKVWKSGFNAGRKNEPNH